MPLKFPENDLRTYPATVKFTVIDEQSIPVEGIETCTLYLPASVQIADKVEYENAELGALGGLAAGGKPVVPSETSDFGSIASLITSQAVSAFSTRAGQVARARTKTAPNPNTRALFKQVSLRTFQFSFKLIPTSESEALQIPRIIKYFRRQMYPKDIEANFGDGISLGYNFPDKFQIEMFYEVQELASKIAPSYLQDVLTNYNPTNQTFFKRRDGTAYFSEIDLNLTFTEARTLSQKSIDEGY